MIEIGGYPYLGEEAVVANDGGQIGVQNLDRYFAIMLEVLSEVDCRHSPGTNLSYYLVTAG